MKIIFLGNPIPLKRPRFSATHTYDLQTKIKEELMWEGLRQIKKQWTEKYRSLPYMPPQTGLSLSFTFFMPIPRTWSNKKKKSYAGVHHTVKPDIDNILKFYLDVLSGVFYVDDKQVHTIKAEKKYIEENEDSRTEIEVI